VYFGWVRTWSSVYVPTMYPPFADMRVDPRGRSLGRTRLRTAHCQRGRSVAASLQLSDAVDCNRQSAKFHQRTVVYRDLCGIGALLYRSLRHPDISLPVVWTAHIAGLDL